jgi:hypothetical protein
MVGARSSESVAHEVVAIRPTRLDPIYLDQIYRRGSGATPEAALRILHCAPSKQNAAGSSPAGPAISLN